MAAFSKPRVSIVGAGLGGALLACYLARDGYAVELYEKRHDPRQYGPEQGRSINLALSVRGIAALREVGLAEEVLQGGIPMRGRMIHSLSGELAFQAYGKDPSQAIHSVSRAELNMTLLNAATRYPGVRLFFEHKCDGIDLECGTLEIVTQSAEQVRVPAEIVIGADGAYSAIRAQMQKREGFNFQQEYLSHGYKELTIPSGPRGEFLMDKHALHIWPRHSFMMIALPNSDGSFTCTLFWPYHGPNSFAAINTEEELRRFFGEQFPDAEPLLPNLAEDFFKNPTGALVTIRCSPWHVGGKVLLIGDAAHAVVPFLGQGMNAAFEDCRLLADALARHGPDWQAAFQAYERQRKEHVDTLANLCIDNFLEMRDKVGARVFRLRKRLQIALNKIFPRWYLPLYTLITFTTTPYADGLRRVRLQDWVIRAIVSVLLLLALLWIVWG
jgi:kynurenine 3-monooxygenase